ncbi:MAG: hypothetical protein IPN69_04430 [Acidobacteria bacterium]|nr:hypothetical protein [Acidobacteriota bacterium]
MEKQLKDVLEKCIANVGLDVTLDTLNNLSSFATDELTLTIIANAGVHVIPPKYLRGESYSASHGNMDFSTQEVLLVTYKDILSNLAKKLHEKPWSKIYLIPTGHSTLALQIKLFVYHILRIDTINLFYHKGEYFELTINHREVVLDENK